VFEINLGPAEVDAIGDLIAVSGDTWSLTNVSTHAGGLVSNVMPLGAESFDFTEPVSGSVTKTWVYDADAFVLYTIDGVAATFVAFEDDLSVGDTAAVVGGNGTTAAKTRTFALTNGTASGTISDHSGFDFNMKPSGGAAWADDIDPATTDTLTVDGVAKTEGQFEDAMTVGDKVTYSRIADKQTIHLTNQGVTLVSGTALAWLNTGFDFGIDTGATAETIAVYDSGFVGEVTVYKVNGVNSTQEQFETALTPGDAVTWQAPDGEVNEKTTTVTLTTGAFSGRPADPAVLLGSIRVRSGSTGPLSDWVRYDTPTNTNIDLKLTGATQVYKVNGVSKSVAQFEAAMATIISGATTGNVTATQTGTVNTWSVTFP